MSEVLLGSCRVLPANTFGAEVGSSKERAGVDPEVPKWPFLGRLEKLKVVLIKQASHHDTFSRLPEHNVARTRPRDLGHVTLQRHNLVSAIQRTNFVTGRTARHAQTHSRQRGTQVKGCQAPVTAAQSLSAAFGSVTWLLVPRDEKNITDAACSAKRPHSGRRILDNSGLVVIVTLTLALAVSTGTSTPGTRSSSSPRRGHTSS